MKNKTHELIDRESGKIVCLILNGKTLISETGKPDKLRITEKVFESTDEAEKNFYKKEWASLKKGFILHNENANIGEAILHKFIGGYYTGALSFAQTIEGSYIYKSNGFDCKDSLVLIDNQGNELSEITLPKNLAWDIEYRSTTNSLLFDLDHYVFEYKIDNNAFDNIGKSKKTFTTSFVSVSNDKIAFATDGKITIVDNDNNILQTMKYETETIKGSTPFSGILSKDGSLLALHNKMGEIQIIDTSNCNVIKVIHSDFNMVDKMEFSNDNSLLIFNEEYGTHKMRYFDIDKNTEIEFKSLEIPNYNKDVCNFCFNEDQSKLVLVQRSTAYVYDFITKKILHSFDIEHLIKGCSIKFIDNDKLAIRTDYACFSIYRV